LPADRQPEAGPFLRVPSSGRLDEGIEQAADVLLCNPRSAVFDLEPEANRL
jgi:hypothetical protein